MWAFIVYALAPMHPRGPHPALRPRGPARPQAFAIHHRGHAPVPFTHRRHQPFTPRDPAPKRHFGYMLWEYVPKSAFSGTYRPNERLALLEACEIRGLPGAECAFVVLFVCVFEHLLKQSNIYLNVCLKIRSIVYLFA